MTKVPQPKWLGDFFCLYYFGFANCKPILYISNMEDTTPTHTYNYSNEYGFGFAKCQPFLYIEDIS